MDSGGQEKWLYRMAGPPIFELTLWSADAMLLRLLKGDESVGGTKNRMTHESTLFKFVMPMLLQTPVMRN